MGVEYEVSDRMRIQPPIDLIQKTNEYYLPSGEGLRVYEHPDTGQELFSVTSIQSGVHGTSTAVKNWRSNNPGWADFWTHYCQIRGEIIHELILGQYADRPMPGYELPYEVDPEEELDPKDQTKMWEDVEKAKRMWRKIWTSEGHSFGDVRGIEVRVFIEEHAYAGTFDLLMNLDGKLTLCDLKTGKGFYPKYAEQISAYWHAAEEMFDIEIEQACVIRLNPDERHNPFLEPELHWVEKDAEGWFEVCKEFQEEVLPLIDDYEE